MISVVERTNAWLSDCGFGWVGNRHRLETLTHLRHWKTNSAGDSGMIPASDGRRGGCTAKRDMTENDAESSHTCTSASCRISRPRRRPLTSFNFHRIRRVERAGDQLDLLHGLRACQHETKYDGAVGLFSKSRTVFRNWMLST